MKRFQAPVPQQLTIMGALRKAKVPMRAEDISLVTDRSEESTRRLLHRMHNAGRVRWVSRVSRELYQSTEEKVEK